MMAPAGPNRHYRWRGDGKSSYAARFHRKVWEKHEKDIRSLHAEGRTKNQILHVLYNQHDFRPSYGQLRKKLGRWFSKTTHSIELSSAATSLSERPLSPKKSCMDSLSLQSSRDGISLTKEEEEEEKVFKTFTSILDDANESLELSTGDSEHSSTDAKGDFSTNQKDVLQQKGFPSSSKSTTSSGDHPPPPTLAKPPQTNQIGRHPFTVVDVDPDEDEHPTVFGPSLPNQWSASTDSKNFEGLPTQISREYRKRYNSHQGLDSNTSRVMNKTRQRMRYTCCACGQVAHSIACEGCMHKRCGGCQTSPIARRIVNKD
jgi:hypothetical protein